MYISKEHEFYSILQIKEEATIQEIHRQYARLSDLYHPSKNPGEEKWCNQLQAKLDDAYEYMQLKHAGVRCDHLLGSSNNKNCENVRRAYEPWRPDVPYDVATPYGIPQYASSIKQEEYLPRKHQNEIARQISVVCASIVIGAVSIYGIFAFKQNANASETSVSRTIAVNNPNSSTRMYHVRKDASHIKGNSHNK